ncbi:MAG: hypothetical protein ABW019_15685 [Chitinophagaceae bacterium]
MPFTKFLLILLLLAGCKNPQIITITGYAGDEKDGARVKSGNDDRLYSLSGMDSWHDSIRGRQITVSGTLKTEEHKASTDGVIRQEMVGTIFVINNPKWKLNPAILSLSGKAVNEYGQAAIRSDADGLLYFIRDHLPWTAGELNQSIRVSGELFVEPNMPIDIPGRNYPEVIETYRSIKLRGR